jgi:ubiquinone/menaquinone biosynthesis C-methylase UbiE
MDVEGEVARHYAQSELTRTVLEALRAAGKDLDALDAADLSPVDEFHTGWAPQTVAMAKTLGLAPGVAVLDVGSGIGGPARYFARAFGADVTGIDLTPAFVELATDLTARTGLADRVRFVEGSALDLPFEDGRFDLATMNHVGMNIADKARVFAEVRRVLKPGGRFVVYDLMRTGEGELPMPMPWADTAATSFVETPERYRALLAGAGFTVAGERDWTELVLAVAAEMRSRIEREGMPVLGVHLLLGPTARERLGRVITAIRDGLLAPTEIDAVAG